MTTGQPLGGGPSSHGRFDPAKVCELTGPAVTCEASLAGDQAAADWLAISQRAKMCV